MADMEAVNSFNAELQSLYDVKPPISKGKMTSLTRAALKAVKLYKHVVQSVEKFIQKCKSEYKIPGLYVIDSIIRQSRHQFGPEKDVFAQRFARNIQTTFVHLYRCPEEDKAKIIRVLNLWQKNKIFSPQVIQPLFDLADPTNPIWEQINSNPNSEGGPQNSSVNNSSGAPSNLPLPPVHFNKKVLDFDYGDGDDDGVGGKEGSSQGGPSNSNSTNNVGGAGPLDALGSILNNPEILRQLQTIQEQMQAAAVASYSTPEQERIRKLAELSKQEAAFDQRLAETVARLPFAKDCELPLPPEGEQRGGDSVDQNSNQVGGNAGPSNVLLPPPFFQQLTEQQNQQQQQHQQQNHQQQQLQNLIRNMHQGAAAGVPTSNPFGLPMPFPIQGVPPPQFPQEPPSTVPHNLFAGAGGQEAFFNHFANNIAPQNNHQQPQHPQISISQKIYEEIDLCEEDSKEDVNQLGGSRSTLDRDRDRRGKRSRSQDRHDRSRGGRRSRSRSRDKGRSKRSYRSRSRDRAREEREKEKERQRKGLPSIKREHLSVCSTTLWVGHLSKLVSQEEISDTFGAYGDIVSIDLISPRGCAFIVMNRRQDAVRALDRLKNTKLQGKTITLAWAPGKGVKGKEWKDYWEVTDGVSYIPWGKLRDETNLEEFEDGGCIDEDTLPDFLKNKPKPPSDSKSLMPPLPPLDNDNSQDSNSMGAAPPPQPPLPPHPPSSAAQLMQGLVPGMPAGPHQPPLPTSGIPSLLDPAALAAVGMAGKPPGDTDARDGAPPGMVPGPFGMGPPGMGMMPMGMNLMVPPPMMGMGPNPFQGMAGLPGMPPMLGIPGMVPAPTGPVPPGPGQGPPMGHGLAGLGGPGILGEMPHQAHPSQQQLNDSLLNTSNEENAMSAGDMMGGMGEDGGVSLGKRGKKRSRFADPDDKMSPSGENSMDISNMSPSQGTPMKDDRPVFERLKSLAEGYGFQNNDKAAGVGGSLLGTPPGIGGGPRPLLPNSFSPNPGLLGNRPPVRPLFGTPGGPPARLQTPQSSWAGGFGENIENPFLNPNPSNPFATGSGGGNPFVNPSSNFSGSENPFEIVSNSQGNPFAAAGFGGRRGNWQRGADEWGGRGRGRGGRGGWRGGRGGWGNEQMEDHMGDEESRGFRGRGGGRGGRDSNSWGRGREERGDSRPRSRDGDRGNGRRRSRSRSRGAGDDERGNRRRRNSSENNGDRRRHRSGEDRRETGRHDRRRDRERGGWGGDRQENQLPAHPYQQSQAPEEESWDGEAQTASGGVMDTGGDNCGDINENNEAIAAVPAGDSSWEDDGPPGEEKVASHSEGDVQDHHLSTSNTNEEEHWDNSSRDVPTEEQHPNQENEDHYEGERQDEEEYPAQEQEYGDDYQPQEEENEYQEEEEQQQQHHDKTEEYGGDENYNNADYNEEADGVDNEVYDNGDGDVYENNEDYSNNYNNENEENFENERDEYSNEGTGEDEDYQCNNSGGDDSHVMPDSSSSYTQNNGESEETSIGGKCTSSLDEKPSEELNNSIAS